MSWSWLLIIVLCLLLIFQLVNELMKGPKCGNLSPIRLPPTPDIIGELPVGHSSPDLSAVLLFRLFEEDALNVTRKDLLDWLDYMRYAGVEHFYLYDNCRHQDECVSELASVDDVTYTRWSVADYARAQVPAYNHHLKSHFPQARYEILLDMDEYPFMLSNTEPNFLRDYVRNIQSPQILLRTLFFGGTPRGTNDWRVLRYTTRRVAAERDGRTKPIYQPNQVDYHGTQNLHEMLLKNNVDLEIHVDPFKYSNYDRIMGYDKMEDPNILRLNHYWCERLPDSETLVEDTTMSVLIKKVNEWKRRPL
jgi:Glycosyltransferase family 92